MSGALSTAWSWSVRYSPLLRLWRWLRGIGRSNRPAGARLKEAGLPAPIEGLIRDTIARTRLWSSEREQVALELIAHAHDALGADRCVEEIIETFGQPRVVARLLRRSMKRKRPLPWRMLRFTRRFFAATVLLLIVGYGVLAMRFYAGEPSIKKNYLAPYQARNGAYREDQKSWTVLAEAGNEWDHISNALRNAQTERITDTDRPNRSTGMYLFPDTDPAHPDFDEIADAVRAFGPQLARLREAARLPVVGLPIGYEMESVEAKDKSWTVGIVEAHQDDYIEHALIGIMLPNLGWSRRLAQVLVFDARLAVIDDHSQRAADDLVACLGLARQCDQQPFMISRLVGMAIQDMVGVKLSELLLNEPGAFTRDQLIALAHANAALNRDWGLDLESERVMFRDMLQRVYTDNGHGNGRLTAEGLETTEQFMTRGSSNLGEVRFEKRTLRAAARPLVLAVSNDRNTERRRHEAFLRELERVMDEGPGSVGRLALLDAHLDQRVHDSEIRFSMSDLMSPSFTNAVERNFQNRQLGDATGVMLSLELFRMDHDRLPASLVELVPDYLPAVPQDIMDPGQPVKYAHDDGGGYVLYSVGSDGDDDGGTEPDPAPNERLFPRLRYPVQITWTNGKPRMERDAQGNPKQLAPQGPDSDWILADMRPRHD